MVANSMESKKAIIKQVARGEHDTGSVQVQVINITDRIHQLSKHLNTFKKDHSSKSGLLKLIAQRRTFMNYLETEDEKSYKLLMQYIDLKK